MCKISLDNLTVYRLGCAGLKLGKGESRFRFKSQNSVDCYFFTGMSEQSSGVYMVTEVDTLDSTSDFVHGFPDCSLDCSVCLL